MKSMRQFNAYLMPATDEGKDIVWLAQWAPNFPLMIEISYFTNGTPHQVRLRLQDGSNIIIITEL